MTPEEHWDKISSGIRHLRQDRGLSLRAVGQRAGLPHSTVARAESGKAPDTMTLLKILHALGLEVHMARRLS